MVQIKPRETLTGKDRLQYIKDVTKARNDPVWFMKNILGWESIFKKQEEITRTFYQHLYSPNEPEYKKLIIKAGQRCLSASTLILTKEYGHITISEVFNKFHSSEIIHVKNTNGWVRICDAFYTGFKSQYVLSTHDKTIRCSIDHKFYVNNQWIPLKDIKSGDRITVYDTTYHRFYTDTVIGWDQEEFTIEMYDLHVPEGNSFVADGILTHNSGKSALGAKICGFEFFKLLSLEDPAEHFGLMKHQPISINCVAASKSQAVDGLFSIMRVDFEENEWINQWYDLKFTDDRVDCKSKHVFAKVAAAKIDSGAATGSTSAACFGDEVDLWHNQTLSKLSASLVWSKMVNSTQTLGIKGKCIAISSVQDENGMINQLYSEGLDEKTTLTYNLKTWEMNDRITKEMLLEEYKYKMDMFWRDFANEPSASSGYVFPGDSLKLNRDQYNVFETGEVPEEYRGYEHVMAVDPAYRNDSFGIACGFRLDDWIIVDGVTKFQKDEDSKEPYIKPSDIENYILEWITPLNVETFIFDIDAVLPTVEKLERDYGINCIKHIAGEETYGMWVNLNDGLGDFKLSVPHNEYLRRECKQLTKRELPSGKIRIDHPNTKTGSKDMSDCVSHVIWYLASQDNQHMYNPVIPGFATF
jgi:hypothetical protein